MIRFVFLHIDKSINEPQYRRFIVELLGLFHEKSTFLEFRGSLIIRQLCVLLNAEFIYRIFAEVIYDDTGIMAKKNMLNDHNFAATMVRTLHSILITSTEMFELRSLLKDIGQDEPASLFSCLYRTWSHCPVSTLSLCLLCQCYQHVSRLVDYFADLEITVDLLTEIDKLVQMIESPIFACECNLYYCYWHMYLFLFLQLFG